MPVDPYLADVSIFAGNFAPRGWAFCDGQLLPISQYSALFSILGTVYGGDGRTSFGLPDLRGRVPIGPGSGPGLSPKRQGERGGNETTTLSIAQMPSHNHAAILHSETAIANSGNPQGKLLGAMADDADGIYADAVAADELPMHPDSVVVAHTGGGQSFSNEQPYLGIHYIIALQGVFPSRS